jgi:hypothetical protein
MTELPRLYPNHEGMSSIQSFKSKKIFFLPMSEGFSLAQSLESIVFTQYVSIAKWILAACLSFGLSLGAQARAQGIFRPEKAK